MYANNIIIAKDTLGNEWEFGNLSCASSSENLSYANLTDIKWSGTELTLSHNGVTRSFTLIHLRMLHTFQILLNQSLKTQKNIIEQTVLIPVMII